MKERRNVRKAAEWIWNYSLDKWGLEFSDQSRENLVRANELLATNSLVFYINHTTTIPDIVLPASMVLAYLPNANRRIAPVADKHYSFGRDPLNAIGLRVIESIGGIDLFPVVQPDKLDAKANEYKQSDREAKTQKVMEQMKSIVAEPSAVFGIASEATRTNGCMVQGARGLGMFSRFDPEEKLRYADLAIAMGQFHEELPRVVFGAPLSLSEVFEKMKVERESVYGVKDRFQLITDVHMRRLALDLPSVMRGVYAEEVRIL